MLTGYLHFHLRNSKRVCDFYEFQVPFLQFPFRRQKPKTPRDRQSSFDPAIVKKRQTILADNLADKIIGLHGLGMGYGDICAHIKEMYDTEISHSVLTEITDRIIPDIKAWQRRPLDAMYCIVWLDAMHYKVKEDGKVRHKAIYNILGIDKNGYKDVLGMYISESEGANF